MMRRTTISKTAVLAAWAVAALAVVVPAQTATAQEAVPVLISAVVEPEGEFSAATEFIDSEFLGDAYPAVNWLASQGILDGTQCHPAEFCSTVPIQRWVAAVWLVRFIDGADPDRGSGSRFTDVDSAQWWAPHVERLAELGITNGCATDRFCGDEALTRAQMASLLSRPSTSCPKAAQDSATWTTTAPTPPTSPRSQTRRSPYRARRAATAVTSRSAGETWRRC